MGSCCMTAMLCSICCLIQDWVWEHPLLGTCAHVRHTSVFLCCASTGNYMMNVLKVSKQDNPDLVRQPPACAGRETAAASLSAALPAAFRAAAPV